MWEIKLKQILDNMELLLIQATGLQSWGEVPVPKEVTASVAEQVHSRGTFLYPDQSRITGRGVHRGCQQCQKGLFICLDACDGHFNDLLMPTILTLLMAHIDAPR